MRKVIFHLISLKILKRTAKGECWVILEEFIITSNTLVQKIFHFVSQRQWRFFFFNFSNQIQPNYLVSYETPCSSAKYCTDPSRISISFFKKSSIQLKGQLWIFASSNFMPLEKEIRKSFFLALFFFIWCTVAKDICILYVCLHLTHLFEVKVLIKIHAFAFSLIWP